MGFARWHAGRYLKAVGKLVILGLPVMYFWSRQQPAGTVPWWGYVWLFVGGAVLWCCGAIIQGSTPRDDDGAGST
jgi:hypothetical protein